MSWPYSLPYQQNNQYFNNILANLSCPLYYQNFNDNKPFKTLVSSFYNFPLESSIFTNHLTQNHSNNFETFRSTSRICLQNLNFEKKEFQVQASQKQENVSEESNNGQKEELKEEKQIFELNKQKKVKKIKNLISHNCSLRNDTKNIPKNYGKAMLSYIQKNSRQVKQILLQQRVDYLQFMIFVKSCKSRINTIHDLREMWGEHQKDNKIMKCLRILSYHFMRKKCLPYIFNSRIKNFHTHIKYRKKIMEGIQNPQNFTKIKEF